jgi:hypothetical protein
MNNLPKIINIESDNQQVKIDFCYVNRNGYGGWVRISPNSFIRPSGSEPRLVLSEAINISLAPEYIVFEKNEDVLYFTLIFPPLPNYVTEIDIIEDESDENAFNFYNILIKSTPNIMATHSSNILRNIEQLALNMKSERKAIKSLMQEMVVNDKQITELSELFKLPKDETTVLSLALYISVINDIFCLSELKHFCNFSPFDLFEIKNIISSLVKKGWLCKSGARGVHRGNRMIDEKSYKIPNYIMSLLHKNEIPDIIIKEHDAYSITNLLYGHLKDYVHCMTEFEDMQAALLELEEEFHDINPIKTANELELKENERLILYYLVTKTSIGEEIIDVDILLSNIFKTHMEKLLVQNLLKNRKSLLFKNKYVEFIKEDFQTDKKLKLTEDGIKKIFGENSFFLAKNDDFTSGLCKLIKYDSIVEKNLIYNESEQQTISSVSEILKKEKFDEIVRRLEENKMRPGLTILLHGYPGTGKTETIYQLARQTKRNILLVDISEIRDKWVGESEKRLKAVFGTYRNSLKHFEEVPILLFNESDALIGKRINVNTSVDQMNNAMQNILLQELEDFKGILMATSNLTSNLDEAFERRFLFKIKYSKPSIEAKIGIWRSKLQFLNEKDACRLAQEFDFSGGQIENISRKLFLDTLLMNKSFSVDDIIHYCNGEILTNTKNTKIGF